MPHNTFTSLAPCLGGQDDLAPCLGGERAQLPYTDAPCDGSCSVFTDLGPCPGIHRVHDSLELRLLEEGPEPDPDPCMSDCSCCERTYFDPWDNI